MKLEDIADPSDVPQVLRLAADRWNESVGELQAAWGDKQAGKIWGDFARILERAADQCEKALNRRGL